jgi:hypothetical protein
MHGAEDTPGTTGAAPAAIKMALCSIMQHCNMQRLSRNKEQNKVPSYGPQSAPPSQLLVTPGCQPRDAHHAAKYSTLQLKLVHIGQVQRNVKQHRAQ